MIVSLKKKCFLLTMAAGVALVAGGQEKYKGHNYVVLKPSDNEAAIIKKAANVTPSPRQLRWQELELTAFFHFGMNTFTDREWGQGNEDPAIFNPGSLDARQWVRTAKEAGFKQVILTAKHHDGFCLWPSKYTEHSVKNAPWKQGKGDVVKEVADACREYGIGFGVYLSPWDRNCPFYGDSKAYNEYFEHQLTELLTQYGKVDEVWFDGANGTGPNGKKPVYDFNSWYKLIRKAQPGAVIAIMGPDVRWVGTESGYGRETEWSVMPVNAKQQDNIAANSQKDITFIPDGDITGTEPGSREKILHANALIWYPAETDVSIRPGWFYHTSQDEKVKTPEQLLDIYYSSVGRNSVLLMNIPPDKNGLINEHDIKHLQEWKRLIDQTFKTNLAKGAVTAPGNQTSASRLTDNNTATSVTVPGTDSTGAIEFTLPAKATFDVLSLQENIRIGQRIEKFALEYSDGNGWHEIVHGTTVGYKRLLRFAPVTASKIRLKIMSSRQPAALAEFGLYKQAQ